MTRLAPEMNRVLGKKPIRQAEAVEDAGVDEGGDLGDPFAAEGAREQPFRIEGCDRVFTAGTVVSSAG
jgi:hypothetical protein